MPRKPVPVIAPGRGSYGTGELGYLARHHGRFFSQVFAACDNERPYDRQGPITARDGAERFQVGRLIEAEGLGGQRLYPCADEAWCDLPDRRTEIAKLIVATEGPFLSIDLGG